MIEHEMVKIEPTLQLLRSDEACIRALEREQENTETALRVLGEKLREHCERKKL
jgi:hypothetical protein